MPQLPPVKLDVFSEWYDLLMTILEENKDFLTDDLRHANERQMKKLMRFPRRYEDAAGQARVDLRLYPSDASEIIWLLLVAAGGNYEITKKYSADLKER